MLMDAADRVVLGSGKLEEIMAASTDISASTAQLVIASRVKAREGSEAFELLRQASKVRSRQQILGSNGYITTELDLECMTRKKFTTIFPPT